METDHGCLVWDPDWSVHTRPCVSTLPSEPVRLCEDRN